MEIRTTVGIAAKEIIALGKSPDTPLRIIISPPRRAKLKTLSTLHQKKRDAALKAILNIKPSISKRPVDEIIRETRNDELNKIKKKYVSIHGVFIIRAKSKGENVERKG